MLALDILNYFPQNFKLKNNLTCECSCLSLSWSNQILFFGGFFKILKILFDFFHLDTQACKHSNPTYLAPSMRMSSGPSWLSEKPRSDTSNCIDDAPRSNRMLSTEPFSMLFSARWLASSENLARTGITVDCLKKKPALIVIYEIQLVELQ